MYYSLYVLLLQSTKSSKICFVVVVKLKIFELSKDKLKQFSQNCCSPDFIDPNTLQVDGMKNLQLINARTITFITF